MRHLRQLVDGHVFDTIGHDAAPPTDATQRHRVRVSPISGEVHATMTASCLGPRRFLLLVAIGAQFAVVARPMAAPLAFESSSVLDARMLTFQALPTAGPAVPGVNARARLAVVAAQFWDDPAQGPVSTQFFDSMDVAAPLAAQINNYVAQGGARHDADCVGVDLTSGADPGRDGHFAINLIARRIVDVELHGAGTLLVTIPFALTGSVEGLPAGSETFGQAYAAIAATRTRPGAVALDYVSSAALSLDHERGGSPASSMDVLALDIPFADGDILIMSLDTGVSLSVNIQAVPLPPSIATLVGGLLLLTTRTVRQRRARGI